VRRCGEEGVDELSLPVCSLLICALGMSAVDEWVQSMSSNRGDGMDDGVGRVYLCYC
jgi:hypothetical protein